MALTTENLPVFLPGYVFFRKAMSHAYYNHLDFESKGGQGRNEGRNMQELTGLLVVIHSLTSDIVENNP